MLLSCDINLRDNVVLPAPDGEDITSSMPRRAIFGLVGDLFNVLYLLAHLIDDSFEFKTDAGQA